MQQGDTNESLRFFDEFLLLHQIAVAEFRRVEPNFVFEDGWVRIAIDRDGVCASRQLSILAMFGNCGSTSFGRCTMQWLARVLKNVSRGVDGPCSIPLELSCSIDSVGNATGDFSARLLRTWEKSVFDLLRRKWATDLHPTAEFRSPGNDPEAVDFRSLCKRWTWPFMLILSALALKCCSHYFFEL